MNLNKTVNSNHSSVRKSDVLNEEGSVRSVEVTHERTVRKTGEVLSDIAAAHLINCGEKKRSVKLEVEKRIFKEFFDGMKRAAYFYNEGKYEEALNAYLVADAVSRPKGYDGGISVFIADCFCLLGRFKEALPYYARVLKLFPEDVSTLYTYGECLFNAEDYEESIVYLMRARSKAPGDYKINLCLGKALFSAERESEAIECLRLAVSKRPGDFETNFAFGKVLYVCAGSGEDFIEVEGFLDAALEVNAKHVEANLLMGLVQNELGEGHEAVEYFRSAWGGKREGYETNFYLGESLLFLGESEESFKYLEAARLINSESFDINYAYGLCLKELGRREEAVKYLEKAVELCPDSVHAMYRLGHCWFELRRVDKALPYLEKAKELLGEERSDELSFVLGKCYYFKHEYPRALDYMKAVEEAYVFSDHFNKVVGFCSYALGDFGECLKYLERMKEMDSCCYQTQFFYGHALRVEGREGEAEPYLRQALSLRPEEYNAIFQLAGSLEAQGKLNEAVKLMKRALVMKPDSFAVNFHLAECIRDLEPKVILRKELVNRGGEVYTRIVEREDPLEKRRRELEAEFYMNQAVRILNQEILIKLGVDIVVRMFGAKEELELEGKR